MLERRGQQAEKCRGYQGGLFFEWLVNTVVVKEKTSKCRVCVDFTDLNKARPKDPFLVPRIGQLVNATFSHPWMSFLDAFQVYH